MKKFLVVKSFISLKKNNGNPIINPSFTAFILNDEMREQINKYPPLSVPFIAEYKSSISNNIMINQEINGERYPFDDMAILKANLDGNIKSNNTPVSFVNKYLFIIN